MDPSVDDLTACLENRTKRRQSERVYTQSDVTKIQDIDPEGQGLIDIEPIMNHEITPPRGLGNFNSNAKSHSFNSMTPSVNDIIESYKTPSKLVKDTSVHQKYIYENFNFQYCGTLESERDHSDSEYEILGKEHRMLFKGDQEVFRGMKKKDTLETDVHAAGPVVVERKKSVKQLKFLLEVGPEEVHALELEEKGDGGIRLSLLDSGLPTNTSDVQVVLEALKPEMPDVSSAFDSGQKNPANHNSNSKKTKLSDLNDSGAIASFKGYGLDRDSLTTPSSTEEISPVRRRPSQLASASIDKTLKSMSSGNSLTEKNKGSDL